MQTLFVGLTYACFHVAPGRFSQPDTCCDLIFDDGVLLLAGPSTQARAVPMTRGKVHLVQIDSFSAHAALGIAVDEITDRIVPIAEIAPVLAQPLTEVFAAGQAASLVSLSPRRSQNGRLQQAALLLENGATVGQAAEAANFSVRQFERRFVKATGLLPQAYRRISRFRAAIKAAAAGQSLAAAAHAAGFVDQAHFCRETRDFTLQSPTEFLRRVANVQDAKISLR